MTLEQRNMALYQASRQGDAELVRSLLGQNIGKSPPARAVQRTALLEAITAGHADIVSLLLNNGANPNGDHQWGRTLFQGRTIPLHCAIRSGKSGHCLLRC